MKIDGRKIAEGIIEEARREIESNSLSLELGVVLVGNDPVSLSYISQKEKSCLKAGIRFSLHQFPEEIRKEQLITQISSISSSGVIVQLPLPSDLDEQEILDAVSPEKDVDLLTTTSLGRFYSGDFSILPPTTAAIAHILEETPIKGKCAVIVGAGRLVGRPLMNWLISKGATVSVVRSSTPNISYFTKEADIIVSGVGKTGLITGEMVKPGAIVIDAGTSVEGNAIRGDIDIESVSKVASKVSPVPGGVGPITTAFLIVNMITLNKRYGYNPPSRSFQKS